MSDVKYWQPPTLCKRHDMKPAPRRPGFKQCRRCGQLALDLELTIDQCRRDHPTAHPRQQQATATTCL